MRAPPAAPETPITYAYKPSLLGAEWKFRLTDEGLEWEAGARSGRVPYDAIRRLRLSFRPVSLQTHRFVTEIWPAGGPKLQIASSSWRSLVEQERHDASYSAFIRALHRQLATVRPQFICESGLPPLVYWPGVAVSVVLVLALVALTLRALQVQAWGGAAIIAGFLALFAWQVGLFFRRNRPRTYPADGPPQSLLP